MANGVYVIQLRRGDTVLSSLEARPAEGDVMVGRSPENRLVTPAEDHSVSGRHLRLFWKGSSLYVEDAGSRNGVFANGERLVKPRRVSAGDVFALGSCSVLVSAPAQVSKKTGSGFHKLEWLNGDNAGKSFEIKPKNAQDGFTIGLDPANDLCLPDMLVSRHHATLRITDEGECWLHDTSKNGTSVNGEPLHGKERLLKDNDKISIAYFDFRFLDRSVSHTRFFLWVKVLAVAATLLVMGGFYVMWSTASATVEDHLRVARERAAEKDFEAAKQSLVAARLARDADRFLVRIDSLDSQIERWERTSAAWEKAQRYLEKNQLMDARKVLDPLTGGAADAWVWNGTTAVAEKRNAEFAVQALRRYYDLLDVLNETETGLPEQQADKTRVAAQPLDTFLEESKSSFAAQACLAPLLARIQGARRRLELIRQGFAAVDEGISKLDAVNPDFGSLASSLDRVVKDTNQVASVRGYADKYRLPCAELASAKSFIRGEVDSLTAMKFVEVQRLENALQLPKPELCARHAQLSAHRAKLEGHHRDVQELAANLVSLTEALAGKGVKPDRTPDSLTRLLDQETWRKALTFDCFAGKPPSARRHDPCGVYDELVGVEYTFESLRALPENYSGWCLRLLGFSPDCVAAHAAYERIAAFVNFMAASPKWLNHGELGRFLTFCKNLQDARQQLAEGLLQWQASDPRAELVARYYGLWLSGKNDPEIRKDLAMRFKTIQKKVSQLAERYELSSDPEEQKALRVKLLETGLPGDGALHSKWVQQYERGQRR